MAYNQSKQSRTFSRLGSFKKYCETNGFKILKDDLIFIDKSLDRFGRHEFKGLLDGYLQEWLLGVSEAIENAGSAQSLGRKRANLWLLELRRI